jgi:DNA polymerase elongation subunit (family B)
MFTLQFEDKMYYISKSLSKDEYKSRPPQVILKEKMERRGKLVPTGSRIDYVFTTYGNHKSKQAEKVEEESFYRAYRSIIKLDFLYYLEHQLLNPLNEILEKAFRNSSIILFYKERIIYHKIVEQLKSMFSPVITFEDEPIKQTKSNK